MTDAPAPAENTAPVMALRAQYVKDLSFENPRAPHALFNLTQQPAIEVGVNLAGQSLENGVNELAISITAKATVDGAPLFAVELVYAGLIELRNLPQEEAEKALFIAGANLLFPFARRVIADVTRDGGFPPLQLEPMDFPTLYYAQRNPQQQPVAGNA